MTVIMRVIKSVDENIKLFGTTKHQESDKSFEQDANDWNCCVIIDPTGKFSRVWALITVVTLMVTGLYIPYDSAFGKDERINFESFLLDIVFYFDIIFGFFTGYRTSQGYLEKRAKMVTWNYAKSWFIIDIATVIPYELMFTNNALTFIKFIKFLKVLKFVRMFKYASTIKEIAAKYDISITTLRLTAEAIAVVYLVHIAACIYYFVARINDLGPDTWVVKKNIQDEKDSIKYLYAVYWALQTLTTVGYGDIPADTSSEKIVSIFWMAFGVGFYSFTIGNLSSFITSIDAKNAQLRAKLQTIEEFARKHNLPKDLEIRMKSLRSNKNEVTAQDQKDLLEELPAGLRAEVVSHIHAEIINNIIFFKDKGADFLYASLPLARRFNLPEKEILYKEGDPAEEVYFIFKGKIKLQTKEKVTFRIYRDGAMFGENDVVHKEGRDSTAVSGNECQLLVMSKFDFKKLMEEFPEEARKIKINALLRRERHRKEKQKASEKAKSAARKNKKLANKRSNRKDAQHKSAPRGKSKFRNKNQDDKDDISNPKYDESFLSSAKQEGADGANVLTESEKRIVDNMDLGKQDDQDIKKNEENKVNKDPATPVLKSNTVAINNLVNKECDDFEESKNNLKQSKNSLRLSSSKQLDDDLEVKSVSSVSDSINEDLDLARPRNVVQKPSTSTLTQKPAIVITKSESPVPESKPKQKSRKVQMNKGVGSKHINLKYNEQELDAMKGQEVDDNEDYDDEYDDEGEGEDDGSLDELLFLEAVASLNENISMLTINSSEIFNSFQNLVKETSSLSSTLQEFSNQLKAMSENQQKQINLVRLNS